MKEGGRIKLCVVEKKQGGLLKTEKQKRRSVCLFFFLLNPHVNFGVCGHARGCVRACIHCAYAVGPVLCLNLSDAPTLRSIVQQQEGDSKSKKKTQLKLLADGVFVSMWAHIHVGSSVKLPPFKLTCINVLKHSFLDGLLHV